MCVFVCLSVCVRACPSVCLYRIFAIKPAQGLLSTEHQIFVVRTIPEKVKTYKHNMIMRLNDNEKYDKVKPELNVCVHTFLLSPPSRLLFISVYRYAVVCFISCIDLASDIFQLSNFYYFFCKCLLSSHITGRSCIALFFRGFLAGKRS